MIIRHNKVTEYEPQVYNQIGCEPVTVLGGGVPRTVTTHTDINSRYIAPNGNDTTGDGTSALPWLTLEKAIDNLDVTFKIITIIRNSYVGDMVFDAPKRLIPQDSVIQSELNEKAEINTGIISWDEINVSGNGVAFGAGKVITCGFNATSLYESTDNGRTWSGIAGSPIAGVYRWIAYGDIGGTDIWVVVDIGANTVYYSNDNGVVWNLATTLPSQPQKVVFGNGAFFISTAFNGIYRSINGSGWTNIAPNATIDEFYFGNSRWVGSNGNKLQYSDDDGLNWQDTDSPYQSSNWKNVYFANNLWVATGWQDSPYYSANGVNWFQASSYPSGLTGNWEQISYGNGVWVVLLNPGSTGHSCYSLDGKNWKLSDLTYYAPTAYYLDVVFAEINFVAVQTDGTYKSGIMDGSLISSGKNLVLNGLLFNGNELALNGMQSANRSGAASADIIQWCDFKDMVFDAIGLLEDPVIKYCRIHDCGRDGINDLQKGDIQENVFFNIERNAINHFGDILNVEHNTFHNCGNGLKVNEAIATVTALKNNIFSKCGYAALSATTILTLFNSVIEGTLSLVLPDEASCIIGAEALFHSVLDSNFRIRHWQHPYLYTSPGVEIADDTTLTTLRDAGAWDINYNQLFINFLFTQIKANDMEVNRPIIVKVPQEVYTYSGAVRRDILTTLVNYTVNLKASTTKITNEVISIVKYDKPLHVWPVNYDGWSAGANKGAFAWKGTAVDSRVHLTINPLSIASFRTKFAVGGERPEGFFVIAINVAGSSPPWQTAYPFKILEWNDINTLVLENYYPNYPGVGFSNPADGDYFYAVFESMWMGWPQYKDKVGDIWRFSVSELTHTFQLDAWKGYWMYINAPSALLARNYLKIISNDETNLYCKDLMGSNLGGLTPDQYYPTAIDMVMMKSRPADVNPSTFQDKGQLGKHGNDWYPTPGSEENTSGLYQETNFSFDLIESAGEIPVLDIETQGF